MRWLWTASYSTIILPSNHIYVNQWPAQTVVPTGLLAFFLSFLVSAADIYIPYSYSLTVFSPSGKLVQIEHALAAVAQGTTSLGIKGLYLEHLVSIESLNHKQQQTAL